MILLWLILIPLLAGPLAWLAQRQHRGWPRWIALLALLLDLAIAIGFWTGHSETMPMSGGWLAGLQIHWIPRFGISFLLAMDGLSFLLVLLTLFLGAIAVLSAWAEIQDEPGFFYFNLLWTLAGVIGVFLALDLFLFFFFWEVMLVPMYFMIALWGYENRTNAAIKFFLFTQAGGLLMLAAILGLVYVHYLGTGVLTFNYFELLGTTVGPRLSFWLMLGFFLAFAVKLPTVPLHSWLPDAHSEAPTAGSVILAGILLKTGAYGLIRFVLPLFPQTSLDFAPVAMSLGVAGILYGAWLAFAQTDLKRLIAYTSVSHMGFVLLGVYTWNLLALQGVVMQMIAHGISTGALFAIAGAIQQRLHTRDMGRMGGLWNSMPRLSAIGLFFAVASLGLPGLANFVGEVLVLAGAFQHHRAFTVLAALGLILAAVYALHLVQRAFHGEPRENWQATDFNRRELLGMGLLIGGALWLGLYPQPVLDTAAPALDGLLKVVVAQIESGLR